MRRLAFALAVVLTPVSLAACSSAEIREHARVADDGVIGGFDARSASMDAVGALVIVDGEGEFASYNHFCTGTLIAPQVVLTAKHCVLPSSRPSPGATRLAFVIGPDVRTPRRAVPIVALDWETTVRGNPASVSAGASLGSDVAVAYLGEAVTEIAPLDMGLLTPADIGQKFVAIGYGIQDDLGTSGTRRAGTVSLRLLEGNVLEMLFGGYDAYAEFAPKHFTFDSEMEMRNEYDGMLLNPGYEAHAGAAEGDAQPCFADSGGPLLARRAGKSTVVGVLSWVFRSKRTVCELGGVYGIFGPAAKRFVDQATAWRDPCAGIATSEGACQGDTAVRCTRPEEGARRVVRIDCSAIGQRCGVGLDTVECVD